MRIGGKVEITANYLHRFMQPKILRSVMRWELGIYFRKYNVVGKSGKIGNNNDNLVPCYVFGIKLLIIEFWINITVGNTLKIKMDE